jgi:hypothetical protein
VLTQRRAETNQSWLAWLRQMPEAAKPVAMLGLIERLDHVRAAGLDPGRGHQVQVVSRERQWSAAEPLSRPFFGALQTSLVTVTKPPRTLDRRNHRQKSTGPAGARRGDPGRVRRKLSPARSMQ